MATQSNCNCEICDKLIYRSLNTKPKHITCSDECKSILNKQLNGKYVICDACGISFYKKNSRISSKNFCCATCAKQYRAPILSHEEIINLHLLNLYDYEIATIAECSSTTICKILNMRGYKNRRAKINNIELRQRISDTNSGKRTGVNNHMYKGKSKFTSMARGLFNSMSKMYMLKNNYTCKLCGKYGGTLNTHHIKPFSVILDEFLNQYPEITTDVFSDTILSYPDFIDESNLVLVCSECHRNIHDIKNNNPELSPYRWESATTIESIDQVR